MSLRTSVFGIQKNKVIVLEWQDLYSLAILGDLSDNI